MKRNITVFLKSKSSFMIIDLQSVTDPNGGDLNNDYIGYQQNVIFTGSSQEAIVSGLDIEYVVLETDA